MNRYEQTTIWNRNLAVQYESDLYSKERELLRVTFENFRERAKVLASEIHVNLPDFTVHDISHIDALWEMTELITDGDYKLTPPEVFVLGGAFLIHDLGMGLAAFPEGVSELKKSMLWKDTVASLIKGEDKRRKVTDHELQNPSKEIEKEATNEILRLLHAKHAENLAQVSWTGTDKNKYYLIENSELRESYGKLIGQIAHSHWWSIEELQDKLPTKLGAPGMFPQDWTVDPIKLACLLRVADACHIDDRRAPGFLRAVRKPSSYADKHWAFQQKLYQPRLERGRVVYTSKSPFRIEEVDSWWLCYETLKLIDSELREVDSLLADTNRQQLRAIGVASISNLERLSKLITVDGWQPVDTKINVGNVAKLVKQLGGEQLYGSNLFAPLRELIQNATDAIRARRILEEEDESWGKVVVRTGVDEDGYYIEVEDSGLGMSPKVLTGPFLDFGQSFWSTKLMHEEFPGLESKPFSSTGKYGVGFFSVFMWGTKVRVSTRRYDGSRDSTSVLEFQNGVDDRPLLRNAFPDEYIKNGGTKIRVWLSSKDIIKRLLEPRALRNYKLTYQEFLENKFPTLNVDLYYEDEIENTKAKVISSNDWKYMDPLLLIKRTIIRYELLSDSSKEEIENFSKNMRIIKNEDGEVVARALIFPRELEYQEESLIGGCVTVGGTNTNSLTSVLGVFIGEPESASRDTGIPLVEKEKMIEWSSEQSKLIAELNCGDELAVECASVIRAFGGECNNLKISKNKVGYLSYSEIVSLIKASAFKEIICTSDSSVFLYEKEHKCTIDLLDNAFIVDVGVPGILQTGSNRFVNWPPIRFNDRLLSLESYLEQAIAEAYGIDQSLMYSTSDISDDDYSFSGKIGTVSNNDVIMEGINKIYAPVTIMQ
ncbi:HD domain-containing protein [Paenibacillus lautus]|uniref:HD domain-containing protein n=1 Tax=Paenibacillus lautus TaxID=1401 RepID=UPI003D2871AA